MRNLLRNRRFGAGVLALYALVAGFLLPLHALHEATGEVGRSAVAASPGDDLDAACGSGPCQNPRHHHGPAHEHDPATCSSCAARGLAATVPVAAVPTFVAPLRTPLPASPSLSAPRALRRAFPARGPPAA